MDKVPAKEREAVAKRLILETHARLIPGRPFFLADEQADDEESHAVDATGRRILDTDDETTAFVGLARARALMKHALALPKASAKVAEPFTDTEGSGGARHGTDRGGSGAKRSSDIDPPGGAAKKPKVEAPREVRKHCWHACYR